ncbi:MAG: PaaX family transcriptional regulator [Cognatishimia sp.]|uniref:PaaX family transcriptional regulator C-terminal domain-containing protein n=1 Tax=Cognatishimia sp. TaxID=2211648 RepID=UPI003B8C3A3C
MKTEEFRKLVATFNDDQTPRVWSLLVTVFGELTQGKDVHVSGSMLSRICAEIAIKPEAMRVALHRLRKNGWINSQKSGRTSDYFLTSYGLEETLKARPIIYATRPPSERAWLCICNSGQQKPEGVVSTGAQSFVTNTQPSDSDLFAIELQPDESLPCWMFDKICDPNTISEAVLLAEKLRSLNGVLNANVNFSPLQTAVLRILIVHSWRRIVLKVPPLPDHMFGSNWAGKYCRSTCHDFLIRFPKPDLDELTCS